MKAPKRARRRRGDLRQSLKVTFDESRVVVVGPEELIIRIIGKAIAVADGLIVSEAGPEDVARVRDARDYLVVLASNLHREADFIYNMAVALAAVAVIYAHTGPTQPERRDLAKSLRSAGTAAARQKFLEGKGNRDIDQSLDRLLAQPQWRGLVTDVRGWSRRLVGPLTEQMIADGHPPKTPLTLWRVREAIKRWLKKWSLLNR